MRRLNSSAYGYSCGGSDSCTGGNNSTEDYQSDGGDSFNTSPRSSQHSEEHYSGYTSEGGACLYAQRKDMYRTGNNNYGVYTTEESNGVGTPCGYTSDGGATRYARCMQQRFLEGMRAVRQSMNRENGLHDTDRYEYPRGELSIFAGMLNSYDKLLDNSIF